ncbi:hypothetical protein ABZT23_39530 [Streptomyces sp. NPDC005386]|uniref:hypothetical protein n=1 Tax=Streptomyces sp. NPDC005386 TaxID=3154562 RepID=UPI0033B5ACFB
MPVTDTPWAPGPAGTHLHALPSPGPVSRPPGLPSRSQGLELGPAADLTPQGAAELAVAAETGGGQARELARRLARSLSPEARRILLDALTEAAPDDGFADDGFAGGGDLYGAGRYEDHEIGLGLGDEEGGGEAYAYGVGVYGSGDGLLGGVPGATAVGRAGLSLVPGRPERGPGRVSGRAGSGRGAPPGVVRLRFADEAALERAGAAFGAGPGGAFSDPAALTLQIRGEAGTESLRAVLGVLDAAAVTAESLTVHSHELDDVFSALTGLP